MSDTWHIVLKGECALPGSCTIIIPVASWCGECCSISTHKHVSTWHSNSIVKALHDEELPGSLGRGLHTTLYWVFQVCQKKSCVGIYCVKSYLCHVISTFQGSYLPLSCSPYRLAFLHIGHPPQSTSQHHHCRCMQIQGGTGDINGLHVSMNLPIT